MAVGGEDETDGMARASLYMRRRTRSAARTGGFRRPPPVDADDSTAVRGVE